MPLRKMQRYTESDLQRVTQIGVRSPARSTVAASTAARVPGKTASASARVVTGGNAQATRKPSKFHNHKTKVNGVKFDSKAEARRFAQLSLLELTGHITDLKRQVAYLLIPGQRKPSGSVERAVTYRADFVYQSAGKTIVEDVKGMRTPDYVIKRKLMLQVHGIEIVEIKA